MKPLLLITPLLASLAATAPAASRTWDGGDATTNWNAMANWNPNATIVAGDILVFPSGLAAADKITNNNFAAGTAWSTITFAESGYTLNGNQLQLTDVLRNSGTGTVTVNASLTPGPAGATILADNTGTLLLSSTCSLSLSGRPVTLDADGLTNCKIIVEGPLAGTYAGNLTVDGPGIVEFRGAKNYTATTLIQGGAKLNFDTTGCFGNAANTVRITGGDLVSEPSPPAVVEVPQQVQMVNTGSNITTHATIKCLSGTLQLKAPLTMSSEGSKTLFAESGSAIAILAPVTVSAGLVTKTGGGNLTIDPGQTPNNFSGTPHFIIDEGLVIAGHFTGVTSIGGDLLTVGNSDTILQDTELRLNADEQVAAATEVGVSSDGLFNLNNHVETLAGLNMEAPGHITTGSGELRLTDNFVPVLMGGGEFDYAVFTGNLKVQTANQNWRVGNLDGNVFDDAELRFTGVISGSQSDATFEKSGEGNIWLKGNHTIPRIRTSGGTNTFIGDSPNTDFEIGGEWCYFTGAAKNVTVTAERFFLQAANGLSNADMHCVNLTFSPGSLISASFYHQTPVPGETHDIYYATGTVALTGADFEIYELGNGPETIVPGDVLTIISKSGSAPVTGTFNNYPEGAIVHSESRDFIISYHGGDGNDVTLTNIVAPTGVTRVWDGGGADDNWMTANNWNPNGKPDPGDDLFFPLVAQRKNNNNDFPAGTTFNSITIAGTLYYIGGNRITLNSKLEYNPSVNSTHAFSIDLTLAQDVTIAVTGSPVIQSDSDIDTHGHTLILHSTMTGGGAFALSGNISGSGGVRKTGPGGFSFFDQPQSYTGPTWIEAGTLNLSYISSPGAPGGGTTIAAGATLYFSNSEDPMTCSEDITLHGRILTGNGTETTQLNGALIAASGTATIESSANGTSINGPVSGSVLHKTGTGRITLGGVSANTLSGGMFVDAGELRVQKSFGNAVACPVILGNAGLPAKLALGGSNQLPDSGTVQIVHPSGIFDIGANSETMNAVVMTGGTISGTAAGRLTLETVAVLASPDTSIITAPLVSIPGGGILQVDNGAATPDLRMDGIVYGSKFDKQGPGRVDFMTSIPVEGLDALKVTAGHALFYSNCRFTNIELAGGTLGGQGTVGTITALPGGVVSPGTDSGPGGFGGYAATWSAATTMKVELNGLNPGSEFDQYAAFGALNPGGSKLSLTVGGGFEPAAGAEFMIVRNVSGSPIAGTFASLPEGGFISAPGARVFRITYTGGDGDDVVLTKVDVNPPVIVNHSMTPGVGPHINDHDTHLTVKGTPGLFYRIESSADLLNWTAGEIKMADLQTGLMEFEFFNPKTDPRLFLRARLP